MCFSATVSFIAGASLSAVGTATVKKTKRKEEIPFAMIPLLFGIQQISEGLVWLSFQLNAPLLNISMTYVYSLFSHVLWPIFIPFAIGLLETTPWRRKVLYGFQLIGIIIGLYLLYSIIKYPITSQSVNKSIEYVSPHFYVIPTLVLYFAATCFSTFFSSHRIINVFGALTLLFAYVAYQFYATTFISVWCFFAAILSLIVYLYFYHQK